MKKPRKQRPKAKHHRASASVAAPSRTHTASPRLKGTTSSHREWIGAHRRQRSRASGHFAKFLRRAKSIRLIDIRRGAVDRWLLVKTSCAKHSADVQQRTVGLAHSWARRDRFNRVRQEARSIALPLGHGDREAFALLFMPFLLVATAVAVYQTARGLNAYMTLAGIERPDTEIANVRPAPPLGVTTEAPRLVVRESDARRTALSQIRRAPDLSPLRSLPRTLPEPALGRGLAESASRSPSIPGVAANDIPAVATPEITKKPSAGTLAALAPRVSIERAAEPSPGSLAVMDTDENGIPIRPGICTIDDAPRTVAAADPVEALATNTLSNDAFGLELAKAAQSQVGNFVIYNDAYRRMSYPMGDVNRLFGVCTDVIVRAYRAMGVDLQTLVHQARAGSGDTNIDHRRTEVLRRFFAAHGESLPPSTFADDFRPGDIVTYYRPQNQGSRSHIAMVSSVMAPSGRPMIVHNRGWGPQLEDALFVDQITGHYRYRAPQPTRNAGAEPAPKRLASGAR